MGDRGASPVLTRVYTVGVGIENHKSAILCACRFMRRMAALARDSVTPRPPTPGPGSGIRNIRAAK